MKKILVTGGAGFIGSYLVNKLIKKNYDVMVVDHLKTIGGIPYIHPRCFFVKGDILMPETLAKIKKWKPEIIYHLAAQSAGESAYDNPKFDYLVNGYKKISKTEYTYCSTARKFEHLCGKEGKFYEKK